MVAEKAHFPVVFMCRLLRVSRSGFYDFCRRRESSRSQQDRQLSTVIRDEFAVHPRGCGSRPLVHALRSRGHAVSRKRVVRLMRELQLRPRLKRRFVRPAAGKHTFPTARNVLKRAFAPGAPDKVWASDITYVPTKRGWAYLAVTLDLGTRKVVGWATRPTMNEELVLTPLRAALADRQPPAGLIHHSDRGVQYAGRAHRKLLDEHGAICSMSRKGNCWDNAVVESFFSTLKRELDISNFEDWRAVERAVFAYVDAYYNTRRPHSTLGYVAPNEYERNHRR